MTHRAYKYRLYPTDEQAAMLDHWFAAIRAVYNAAITQREWYGRSQNTDPFGRNSRFNGTRQAKELNYRDIKSKDGVPFRPGLLNDPELSWITSVPREAVDYALMDLDKAFDRFYKTGEGFPKPRTYKDNNSVCFATFANAKGTERGYRVNVRYGKDSVIFPKLGSIRYKRHKKFYGKPLTSQIVREVGRYYVVLVTKHEFSEYHGHTEDAVGIDLGVSKPVVLSTGEYLDRDPGLKVLEQKARKEQQRISRGKKGSNRRKKRVKKLQQIKAKQAARRKARTHAVTTEIVRRFPKVGLENLRIRNMTKSAKGSKEQPGKNVRQKSGLNREILNVAMYEFRSQILYKSEKYQTEVVLVEPSYTSQTCNCCGHVDKQNRTRQESFVCTACGHAENADLNAARNIRDKAFTGGVADPRKTPSEFHQESATSKVIVSCLQPTVAHKKMTVTKQLAMDQLMSSADCG